MHYDKNLLYRHSTLAWFPLEKRLMQSGCYSAPPHPLPSISIALCQPRQAAGPQCHAIPLTSLHNIWPGLHVFSLRLMCMACQESRCRVALSNLLGLPPLSALWIGNAQRTCVQTMPVCPQTLFILPCSNPASTRLLFFPSPVFFGMHSQH